MKFSLFPCLLLWLAICGCKVEVSLEGGIQEINDDPTDEYAKVREMEDQRVNNLLTQYSDDKCLNIAYLTDSHLDLGLSTEANKNNLKDAIAFCQNSEVPISLIIHGGDLVTEIMPSKNEHKKNLYEFFQIAKESRIPFLYTKGNHDLNSINVPPSQLMNSDDWDEVWFEHAEKKYNIKRNVFQNGDKSGYYYLDLAEWKVRVICVDCYDLDYSKVDNKGNILYWGGSTHYIANTQFNWIINDALNFDDKADKDWGVIIFMHFYRPSDVNATTIEPLFDSIFKKFNTMLLEFNKQSVYLEEYHFSSNPFYDLSLHGDWTRYLGVEKKPYLICLLSGHIHTDSSNNWWGVRHFVTANQFCGEEYSDATIKRCLGDRTQNLFDILSLNLTERKIRIIRYGAYSNKDENYGNRYLLNGQSF